MKSLSDFSEVWCCDTEFVASRGEQVSPVCLVARELRTDRVLRCWRDELQRMHTPPYGVGRNSLFIAFSSPAEFSTHLALRWPLPLCVVDLFCEYKARVNDGAKEHQFPSLIDALKHYGLDTLDVAEKEYWRRKVMEGGPWSDAERLGILDYCQSDTDACKALFLAMASKGHLNLSRAQFRGRFMRSVAAMEHAGVPCDAPMLSRLTETWPHIKGALIERVDQDFSVFENGVFKLANFERYLEHNRLSWPRTSTGLPSLEDEVFEEQAMTYPQLWPLRELRKTLGRMRKFDLPIGKDNRLRCPLLPFGTVTSRCTPPASRFIFSASSWVRGLIKPAEGMAIGCIDYTSQEFAVAAALSGDEAMLAAYAEGDVYTSFARMAGLMPPHGTKQSHPLEREAAKQTVLAVNYGMGPSALAARLNTSPARARELLGKYSSTFRRFWRWKEERVSDALARLFQTTLLGWPRYLRAPINVLSVSNFPVQGTSSGITQLACSLAIERGCKLLCSVHDSLVVEGAVDEIEDVVATTKRAMVDAGTAVLPNLLLRSEARTFKYPSRYSDEKGSKMWATVVGLMAEQVH